MTSQRTPWESYEYLTRVSQIPRPERIRSDSASCPDNIWGFPSYAIREAFSARSVSGFCSPLWQVLVEPTFRGLKFLPDLQDYRRKHRDFRKATMRKLEGEQRAQEYTLMGGTNTPVRRLWQSQLTGAIRA